VEVAGMNSSTPHHICSH